MPSPTAASLLTPSSILVQSAALAAVAMAAWALGALVLRGLRLDVPGGSPETPRNAAAAFFLRAAVGFTVWPHLLFALGLAGALRAPIVGGLAMAAWIAAVVVEGRALRRRLEQGGARDLPGEERPYRPAVGAPRTRADRWARVVVLLSMAAIGAVVFQLGLYPPHAFDETTYHLPFARAFVETGGLPRLEHLRVPLFPIHADLLLAAVALFAPWPATHVVALWATVLVAALMARSAGEIAGGGAAETAAALWLGAPIVVYLGSTGYIEAFVLVCLALALWAGLRFRRTGALRFAGLAAAALGTAVAAKYHGLFFLALGGLLLPLADPRRPRVLRRWLVSTGVVGLAALAAVGPMLVRNFWLTANPVYPIEARWLGWLGGGAELAWGRSWAWADLLKAPWWLVSGDPAANDLPPHSPFWWLGGAVLLARGWRRPATWLALAAGVAYLRSFPWIDARYTLFLLPPLVVAIAVWSAAAWVAAPGRRAVVLVAVLAPGLLWGVFHAWRLGPPPRNPAQVVRFLGDRQPLFRGIQALNERAAPGDTAYLLAAESSKFYCLPTCYGEMVGRYSYARFSASEAASGGTAAWLREAGIRWLVVPAGAGISPPRLDDGWRERTPPGLLDAGLWEDQRPVPAAPP